MRRLPPIACALALSVLAAGCASGPPPEWAKVRELTPAFLLDRDARQPDLASDGRGRVALTWVTRDSAGMDVWLAVSSDSGTTFDPPVRVNTRAGSVWSFPENHPIAVLGAAGRLAVVWCERRQGQEEATDVLVRASADGGRTLGPPAIVNDDAADAKPIFHGFPTITFLPNGTLFAAWMDERENRRIEGRRDESSSGLLFYSLSRDGGQSWSDNRKLTDRLCPCCRASAAGDAGGRVAVAYRAAGGNLRDPALAISDDGGRSFGFDTLFSADRWLLHGCPAVGPALLWNQPRGGLYVWYTGAEPQGLYAASWIAEHGRSGVRRALMDSLHDATQPRVASLGRAALIGAEARPRSDTTLTVLAVRELDEDGALTPWLFLGANVEDGGIASLGSSGALACWSERVEDGMRVRVVEIARRESAR